MITLCRPLRILTCNGAAVELSPRAAAYLATLEQCRPGFVHERILIRLAAPKHTSATDGTASMVAAMREIRAAFLALGYEDPLERISCSGWLLRAPVKLIEDERLAA